MLLIKLVFFCLLIFTPLLAMPPNDKALFDTSESRRGGNRRRRPCRGRDNEGRTFLDWNFQHYDVNYNYNYNINCGGSGGQHGGGGLGSGGQKPPSGDHGGGGNRPEGAGLFGGNGPLSFVQSQVQNILGDGQGIGSFLPQTAEGLGSFFSPLTSFFSSGGLFNGDGILSLFDGGFFSNIFNSPSSSSPAVTTSQPNGQDPDDIIYNDEKPVHEDHDDVLPDQYNKPAPYQGRPRQYQNQRSNSVRFL